MNQETTFKVWVVDDDQSIRWVLQKALANQQYDVGVYESGSAALSAFRRITPDEKPDLIMTDVWMPGLNGFDLLKQIKNEDPNLPVIVMTAFSDLETTAQAHQDGAFENLSKPFDIDEALNLVARACQSQTVSTVSSSGGINGDDWIGSLKVWAGSQLAAGKVDILKVASEEFERALLECALEKTRGRKQEAAKLLGWGRNTLTRKLKLLND